MNLPTEEHNEKGDQPKNSELDGNDISKEPDEEVELTFEQEYELEEGEELEIEIEEDIDDSERHPPFPPIRPFHGVRKIITRKLLDKKAFWDMQDLIFLGFIKEESEGITGYDLQKALDMPRGTMTRILDRLEEAKCLKIEEETESGRLKKLYFITEDGKQRLHELQRKWANRSELIDDMAPYEEFGPPGDLFPHVRTKVHRRSGDPHERFPRDRHPRHPHRRNRKEIRSKGKPGERHFRRIERIIHNIPPHAIESKSNALDYLYSQRNRLNAHESRLKGRLDVVAHQRKLVNTIIEKVTQVSGNTEADVKKNLHKIFEEYRYWEYDSEKEKNTENNT